MRKSKAKQEYAVSYSLIKSKNLSGGLEKRAVILRTFLVFLTRRGWIWRGRGESA